MTTPFKSDIYLPVDSEVAIAAFTDISSDDLRTFNISATFERAVSRVGVYWERQVAGAGTLGYLYALSYLGDYTLGSVNDNAYLSTISDPYGTIYLDIYPADRVEMEFGFTATGTHAPIADTWRLAIIGSNNLNLGKAP